MCFLIQCGDTALHEAARYGQIGIIRLLMDGGINIHLQNEVSG